MPKVDNINIANIKFIFYGQAAPFVTSKGGLKLGQHDQDVLEIYKLEKIIRNFYVNWNYSKTHFNVMQHWAEIGLTLDIKDFNLTSKRFFTATPITAFV